MKIKLDPITGLYCRSDGAVLMPPSKRFPKFRWTFGCKVPSGYCVVGYCSEYYRVHRIICRAFHGLPPEDKPEVDHIDRYPANNAASNLRWADRSLNCTNRSCVDKSIEKYGVRCVDDKKAYSKIYMKARYKSQHEEQKAYAKAYHAKHREEIKVYWAAKAAKMKAQGLTWKKGPDGKYGWYPFKRSSPVPKSKNS